MTEQVTTTLISLLVMVLTALASLIVAFLNRKKSQQENAQKIEEIKAKQEQQQIEIEDVKKAVTIQNLFVKCPKCGTEINLSTAEIYSKEGEQNATL